MDRNGKATNRSAADVFGVIFVTILAVALVAVMIWSFAGVFGGVREFFGALSEYSSHEQAVSQISSGFITDKEIVNGHTVNGSGGIVAGSNGSGVVIGGNKEYIPTQYRLYVSGEYEVDGDVFMGDRYFDVPAEVYQAYNIGDYFDSQNFFSDTVASLCPSCGAEWDSTYCGDCGSLMNQED